MRIKVGNTCAQTIHVDGQYSSCAVPDRMAVLTVGFFPWLCAEITEIDHNKQSNKNNPVRGWEKGAVRSRG